MLSKDLKSKYSARATCGYRKLRVSPRFHTRGLGVESSGFRKCQRDFLVLLLMLQEVENLPTWAYFPSRSRFCDAANPGCPLTTRQPAKIYMSHVMRPIHVQKWPLGPTHHIHKMYILYKMI